GKYPGASIHECGDDGQTTVHFGKNRERWPLSTQGSSGRKVLPENPQCLWRWGPATRRHHGELREGRTGGGRGQNRGHRQRDRYNRVTIQAPGTKQEMILYHSRPSMQGGAGVQSVLFFA